MITGANLPLLSPDIKEGPTGKEHDVTVEIHWKQQWFGWWLENRNEFATGVRYRRGKRFTLASCLDEMDYPAGNYRSRQSAYYELRVRSGKHIAPFFADWNVKDQLDAINAWRRWWKEHKDDFPDDQWLFNGNTQ